MRTQLLPPPPIQWPVQAMFPVILSNDAVGASFGYGDANHSLIRVANRPAGAAVNWNVTGGSGASTIANYASIQGRGCYRFGNTGAGSRQYAQLVMGWWLPSFSTGINAGGEFVFPTSAVGVWNIGAIVTVAPGLADTTGWLWIPNKKSPVTAAPAQATPSGGFGILARTAGDGFEFVSYDAAGTVLYRQSALTDVSKWSDIQVIVVTATSSKAAYVTCTLNGVPWVTQKEFDDVELLRPTTIDATSSAFTFQANSDEFSDIATTLYCRFGPQLPDGTEIQQ